MPEQLVPANPEAEKAVLGSILIDPDAILMLSGWLKPDDFYKEKNGWIYQAMLDLNERNAAIDSLTLCDELEARRQLTKVGGEYYVMDLVNATPTAIHVEYYARIVERLSTLRGLIRAAGQVTQMAYTWDPKQDAREAVAQAEALMFSAARSQADGPALIKMSMPEVIEGIEAVAGGQRRGVTTGLANLDTILGRLDKGEVCVVAARPGRGKSALALDIAARIAERGEKPVFFSLEMAKDILLHRLLARTAGVDLADIRMGNLNEENWFRLMNAAGHLSNLPLFLDDTPAMSISELRSKARRLHAQHSIDIIIVDYLQLLGVDGVRPENRTQIVSMIAAELKSLARELDIPILAVAQLSRAVESRANPRPMLSDLRESGAIEQEAAQVVFIYQQPDPDDISLNNIINVAVDKNRHGQTGETALFFRKEHQRFKDLSPRDTERVPLQGQGTHASYSGGLD
jgi:replicative DNA helicase